MGEASRVATDKELTHGAKFKRLTVWYMANYRHVDANIKTISLNIPTKHYFESQALKIMRNSS